METVNDNQDNILIHEYIESLTLQEKLAMEIAKKQLESSFSIEKSIGFIEFCKSKT